MKTSTETIQCPECKEIQQAIVEHTDPWPTKIHHCKCGHVIMESDWNVVEEVIRQTGYYWVKCFGVWEVAYYNEVGFWLSTGTDQSAYPDEINETRILNPDGL